MGPSARGRLTFLSLTLLFVAIVAFAVGAFATVDAAVKARRTQSAVDTLGEAFGAIRQERYLLSFLLEAGSDDETIDTRLASLRQDTLVAMDRHAEYLDQGMGSPELASDLLEAFTRLGEAMEMPAGVSAEEAARSVTLVLNGWVDLRSLLIEDALRRRAAFVTGLTILAFVVLVVTTFLLMTAKRLAGDLGFLQTSAASLNEGGVLREAGPALPEMGFAETASVTSLIEELDRDRRLARADSAENERRVFEARILDLLTGARTRQSFLFDAEHEMARCRRYDRPLSFVGVDIRGLRAINEAEGTAAGDYVLATVGDILFHNVRASDWVARIGDDAFGLMLPETPLEGAEYLASKLQRNIEIFPYDIQSEVSVRVGAVSRGEEESAAALLQDLERSLSESSETG